jgi:hypothetical protein
MLFAAIIVAVTAIGLDRYGSRPSANIIPVYDGAIILSLGIIFAVLIWFAGSAILSGEPAARRLAESKQLAVEESRRSAEAFAQIADLPEQSTEISAGAKPGGEVAASILTYDKPYKIVFGLPEEERGGE